MLAIEPAPFIEYLKAAAHLRDSDIPEAGDWADAGNTIGMLALRMNLLTVEQIDQILEVQENEGNGKRFGELAEDLGLLSPKEVSRLLAIQSLNRQLGLGERLVLTGQIGVPELVHHLNDFVNGQHRTSR